MPKTINVLDWIVIAIYITAIFGIALSMSKTLKKRDDVFLAGRSMKRWPMALSMYMALFSTNSFLGVIGWLNREGGTIWIGLQNIGMMMVVPFVVWLYPTLFYRLNITTAYEYLERRYNYTVRKLGALLFLGARIMWLGTMLYSASLLVTSMGGFTVSQGYENGQVAAIIIIGFIGASFGALGGMRAVIWTDVIQFFILMGSVVLMVLIGISSAGGIGQVVDIANQEGKFLIPQVFNLTDDLCIVSALLLGMVSMLSSSGSDQVVIQTYLTAKSDKEAKKSLILQGFFVKPLSLIFPVLGVIIFVFYRMNPEIAASMRIPDDSLPVFITNVLPAGMRGLAVAAILSALFTSLCSGMTALSAVVQVDFIQRIRKKILIDSSSVLLGRSLIILWGVVIIICAILIMKLGTSNNIIQILNIVMYPFSGVLLGLFLLGLLTKRANGQGALTGVITGFVITTFVPLSNFLFSNILNDRPLNSSGFISFIEEISKTSNFYYGALGVLMTVLVGYMASLLYKPIPESKLAGLVRTLKTDSFIQPPEHK